MRTLVNTITGERREFNIYDDSADWLEYMNCIRAGWIHDSEMSVSEADDDN